MSKKSLKVLDQKLQLLAEHAEFHVNINSVLGSGIHNPEDALKVAHRAVELGFTSTVGILHDGNGQLQPLGSREQEIFEEIMSLGKRSFSRVNSFQHNIAARHWKIIGAAAPARATSISARMAWSTTARSSAAIPASRSLNTPTSSAIANSSPRKPARPAAPFPAFIKSPSLTRGVRHKRLSRNLPSPQAR